MREQHTSNQRVSDADVIRDLKLCAAERAWPVFDLAVATIERLTREPVAARAAEDANATLLNLAHDERDRLRAALEDLAADASESGCLACDRTARKARKALSDESGSAVETFAGTPWVNGPPKDPGSHVVHYESGYYAVLTLTADSMVLRSRRNDNPYGIVRHFRFDVSAQKATADACSECDGAGYITDYRPGAGGSRPCPKCSPRKASAGPVIDHDDYDGNGRPRHKL